MEEFVCIQQALAGKILTSFIGFKIESSLRTKDSPVFRHKAFCRPQNTEKKSKLAYQEKTKETSNE